MNYLSFCRQHVLASKHIATYASNGKGCTTFKWENFWKRCVQRIYQQTDRNSKKLDRYRMYEYTALVK